MAGHLVLQPGAPGVSGLWRVDPQGRLKATDADAVGVSDDLADDIEAWLDAFDAGLDPADETRHAFTDEGERRDWIATGHALARRAAAELGGGWRVEARLGPWEADA
jgi:hypothetical protein